MPFAIGQVLGALLIGVLGGVFVNEASILTFGVIMAVAAAASVMICRLWPGFDGPGWQLWLVGALSNPLLLVAVVFTGDAADCVIGKAKGPSCLFGDIGPLAIGVCLLPPLFGLAARALFRPRPMPRPPD